MRAGFLVALTWLAIIVCGLTRAEVRADESGLELARMLVEGSGDDRRLALKIIERDHRTDMISPMITLMRFMGPLAVELGAVMDKLTAEGNGADWHAWMLWQERHPEISTIEDFDQFKAELLSRIDENFRLFLNPGVEHTVRLEEVVWGGVIKDGIPSLNDPVHIQAAQAHYLTDDELVFGITINGDSRAYPMRIMDWHEMFNDVVGGVPVALAYCTLCGSGILYETGTSIDDRIIFGSSGFLYRSNKLMYDQTSFSLWNQFTGVPVVGVRSGELVELPLQPVVITSWADWQSWHPNTKVLSLETGFDRDYRPGAAYGAYFASPKLMFPNAAEADDRMSAKDYVFVMRRGEVSKTWPLLDLVGGTIKQDHFDGQSVLLLGDPPTRTVRAYAGLDMPATMNGDRTLLMDGTAWQVTEDAIVGDDGRVLERLPGHVAFWFASASFLPDGELAVQ